jgi:hypothetical protein
MRIGPFGFFEIIMLLLPLNVIVAVAATVMAASKPGHRTAWRALFIVLAWLVPLIGPIWGILHFRKPGPHPTPPTSADTSATGPP